MTQSNTTPRSRREFLARVGGASGLVGLTALAGCSTTEPKGNGSGGDGKSSLPKYTYINNPQSYSPERHDAINLIADTMNKAGFDVDVKVMEWGSLYSTVTQQHDYGFATWWTFFTIDPGILLPEYFHSRNTGEGEGNYSGYTNEDLDPKLEAQLRTADTAKRTGLIHDIQKTLMEDVPTMPIAQMPDIMAHNKDQVTNWKHHIAGFNSYYTMVNLKVNNENNELRGTWPESLSTMNVLGHNDENKHNYQFNVIYDRLIQFDENMKPDPELGLATDWKRVDETTMEYTVRESTWHDGEPLTAEDVAFSFNYIKDNEIPLYTLQNQYIEGAEVTGEKTVQLTLAQNLGPVNTILGSQIPIIPKHKWESRSNPAKATISNPVGSGPLVFDYWDKGSELGLKKNPDHFVGVDFDRRFWRIIPETSTQWELLKGGDLNYIPFGGISRQLKQNEKLDQIGVAKAQSTSFWHFTANNRKEGLGKTAVRQAAVNCIPRTQIVEQILFGYPDVGSNVVSKAFGDLHTDDVKTYEESLEAAKKKLKDAGYL
ncbi:ABC transporter substrate-binding protein [Halomarina pelagica]|uniref:ABC transporter substrate-binding protein n=1 Tax=Halomarina pelagica TaxID=2961599 RepID=UPI0020C24AB4|nr:ABC transporter substrate-binding protein [Halomarina sp. BND7]